MVSDEEINCHRVSSGGSRRGAFPASVGSPTVSGLSRLDRRHLQKSSLLMLAQVEQHALSGK